MTSTPPFSTNDAGLSLLEVLIAISLMSLITIAVMGGVTFGTQVWASNDRAYDLLDDEQAIERVLRRHIAQILPIRMQNGHNIAFEGTSTRFQYLTNVRLGDRVEGIHAEMIALRDNSIVLWVNNALLANLEPPSWTPHPMGKTKVSGFRYLDGTTKSWATGWLNKDRLPALIAVDFESTDTPPLILAPMMTLSGLTLDGQAQSRLLFETLSGETGQ